MGSFNDARERIASLQPPDIPNNSLWTTLLSREGTRPSIRVGQVDAELLDEDLIQLLKGQVGEALKYYGTHLQDEWSSEIILTLRAILFKLSIWNNDASYGAALQNLKYSYNGSPPSRLQKSIYGLLTVFGRYGWEKWEGREDTRFQSLTSFLSTTHSIASFISFLIFLINGRYRTLTDRLLNLQLIPSNNNVNREISFEYLNRQLVWHAFTEFLLFVLPLVGINRWKRWLSRAWKKSGTTETASLSFLPEQTCAICYQNQNPEAEILGATGLNTVNTDIVNPYETDCGHIYCYVCVATALEGEEGDGWSCLRCGNLVHRCQPWNGDVLVPETKSSVKIVDFANQRT